MKSIEIKILFYLLTIVVFSSCATIVGGAKYNAHIIVKNRPNAKIVYEGIEKGNGNATVKVKRVDANKFSFTIKEEGCEDQTYKYETRTFRGWAFAGTIVGWTGIIGGIPLPWGATIDLANGALWKPNINESGITKIDYKNYDYTVDNAKCNPIKKEPILKYIDVIYTKNGSIIKGIIIEQIPNVQAKIQTKDGSVFVYKYEEIEKFTKEEDK